jgi:hypothetical protein
LIITQKLKWLIKKVALKKSVLHKRKWEAWVKMRVAQERKNWSFYLTTPLKPESL